MLRIKNLKKVFGSQLVLNGVDLEIHRGEIVGILGSSGSGKSTLLRCMNQLEVPSEGMISIDGNCINGSEGEEARSKIGMVFQNFHLFSHMTVIQNLIYAPIKVRKLPREVALEKAYLLLKRVGLENKANAFPHILSGGEKQRVAISRTLMMDPEMILFDEPTSALDPEMVQEVLKVMQDLASTGITMVIVTHEMAFIREVAGRVVYLEKGKVTQDMDTSDFFEAKKHLGYFSGTRRSRT